MLMEPPHYLDWEVLKHSNYPEVKYVSADIARLDVFFMKVNSSIAAYIEGVQDKIYLDMNEVNMYVELCRDVLEILGNAENPCFDIIINLRTLLEECFTLVYMHRRYGNMYIHYDTVASIEAMGGETYGN